MTNTFWEINEFLASQILVVYSKISNSFVLSSTVHIVKEGSAIFNINLLLQIFSSSIDFYFLSCMFFLAWSHLVNSWHLRLYCVTLELNTSLFFNCLTWMAKDLSHLVLFLSDYINLVLTVEKLCDFLGIVIITQSSIYSRHN